MDWKRVGAWESTRDVVLRNWLKMTHSPQYAAEYLREIDTDPANYPDYYTRHDQDDNPKGLRQKRRWF